MCLFIETSLSVSHILEDFTAESVNWVTRGDAYWDPNGWVEMTGTGQGKKGAVYNKVESIASGTASIRFTIKTGNGMNGGADGFAFTIINVANVTDLDNWISQARSGGGMGYAIGGNSGSFTGDALTVEIDTWHNTSTYNEFKNDPTTFSHIALSNADPMIISWPLTPRCRRFSATLTSESMSFPIPPSQLRRNGGQRESTADVQRRTDVLLRALPYHQQPHLR